MTVVPDKITPEIGWRVWRAWPAHSPRGYALSGVTGHYSWDAKQPSAARCAIHTHSAPDSSCECGLHAAKTLDQLVTKFLEPIMSGWGVIGQVSLWGTVIEGEWGYRAEFAYPLNLYILDGIPTQDGHVTTEDRFLDVPLLEVALAKYGVPVIRAHSISDLLADERIAA